MQQTRLTGEQITLHAYRYGKLHCLSLAPDAEAPGSAAADGLDKLLKIADIRAVYLEDHVSGEDAHSVGQAAVFHADYHESLRFGQLERCDVDLNDRPYLNAEVNAGGRCDWGGNSGRLSWVLLAGIGDLLPQLCGRDFVVGIAQIDGQGAAFAQDLCVHLAALRLSDGLEDGRAKGLLRASLAVDSVHNVILLNAGLLSGSIRIDFANQASGLPGMLALLLVRHRPQGHAEGHIQILSVGYRQSCQRIGNLMSSSLV